MSLAGSGQVNHLVTRKGVEFLLDSARDDGSWPIDTNLATWVTTLSVNALASGSARGSHVVSGGSPEIPPTSCLADLDRERLIRWLLAQQYRSIHPYTNAAPGGWAWTDLPGGVPDADDTAGALLALRNLSVAAVYNRGTSGSGTPVSADADRRYSDASVREAAIAGVLSRLDKPAVRP
jgi:squalene-hopene/tetraprenyl-beta-curcumene cyclase